MEHPLGAYFREKHLLYSIHNIPLPRIAKRSGSFDVSAGYLLSSPLGPFLLLFAHLVNLFSI